MIGAEIANMHSAFTMHQVRVISILAIAIYAVLDLGAYPWESDFVNSYYVQQKIKNNTAQYSLIYEVFQPEANTPIST